MIKNFNENKISVALCAYNGERYLREQLESIFKQTRLPDEIIVCDDYSTDSTLKILDEFRKNSSLPFKIYINEKNLGVSKNFEKAISLCSGDIIFLSDQDDVWLPEKIEKIIEVFNNNKDCLYVFSDAYIVDQNLQFLGYTMWQSILFNKLQRKKFRKGEQLDILLKGNVIIGATMAFWFKMREIILPIPEIWIHDAWIAIIGSTLGRGCFVEKPLIYYRQHNYQLYGGKKLGLRNKIRGGLSRSVADYTFDIQKYKILNDRILKISGKFNNEIRNKILFLSQRIKMYESPGVSSIIIMLHELFRGSYFRYGSGLKSVAKDIFIVFKNLINKK